MPKKIAIWGILFRKTFAASLPGVGGTRGSHGVGVAVAAGSSPGRGLQLGSGLLQRLQQLRHLRLADLLQLPLRAAVPEPRAGTRLSN